jgi:hypothetical protein
VRQSSNSKARKGRKVSRNTVTLKQPIHGQSRALKVASA